MSLADALDHPWLRSFHESKTANKERREATVSPHSSSQPLPDVSMARLSVHAMAIDHDDGISSVSSPPNVIPGAYPSSQQPLQRRRKVLDEARERGEDMPELPPEMLQRMRAEVGDEAEPQDGEIQTEIVDGPAAAAASTNGHGNGKKSAKAKANANADANANAGPARQPQNTRSRKRKATAELSASPMDQDHDSDAHAQNGDEERAITPTGANPRPRRGRGGSTRGRGRGGRAKADSDAGVPVRRSTRAPVPSKSRR